MTTTSHPEPPAAIAPPPSRFLGRIPWTVWLVALVAAVVHIAPFWRAELSARDGWTFEENLTISPDQMQYRIWMRQSQREGPLLTNRFTTEPNRAHLPVFFFWGVGKASTILGMSPERGYAYAGSLAAAILVILVFATVRRFLPDKRHWWWVMLPLLFGGGLGGHLKVLAQVPFIASTGAFQKLFAIPLEEFPPFEDYRSHFIVKSLLDTHSLALWIVGLGAVVAFWLAMERGTRRWTVVAASLFALMTVMHVYEGITLVAIAAGIAVCCWPVMAEKRRLLRLTAVCIATVFVCYAVLGAIYARSGLPLPGWRAISILVTTLLMAYPISYGLMAWDGLRAWRDAGLESRFLFGWILGCTVVTLSGPFFPYPDRGTLTLQVPLFILAALIYFAHWKAVPTMHAMLLVVLCGATPLWLAARTWHFSGFRTDAPFQFVNGSHRAAREALSTRADTSRILLADTPDLLWLAPTFPGRLYVGHFFLTVDHASKIAELRAALGDPSLMPALLAKSGADFVFVNASRNPARFEGVRGMTAVAREDVGWLFATARVTP